MNKQYLYIAIAILILLALSYFLAPAKKHQALNLKADSCALKPLWNDNIPRELQEKGIHSAMDEKRLAQERKAWNDHVMVSYFYYKEAMKNSNYYFYKGQVLHVNPIEEDPNEMVVYSLLQKVNQEIWKKEAFNDGIKILLCDNDKTYEIYYEQILPPHSRGPSYQVNVSVDKATCEIINILGG